MHGIGRTWSPQLRAAAVRSCSQWRDLDPLSPGAGVGKVAKKIHQRVAVARKRGYFAGILWRELRNESGQFRVREASVPVMHAMIGLMEQSKGYDPAEWSL